MGCFGVDDYGYHSSRLRGYGKRTIQVNHAKQEAQRRRLRMIAAAAAAHARMAAMAPPTSSSSGSEWGKRGKAPRKRKRKNVPLFPHEIAARRKRAKAERDKAAKRGRREAMGPREIAASLAAATPAAPRTRGRPRRNRPPTPVHTSPANVLQAVGLVPTTPFRAPSRPSTFSTPSSISHMSSNVFESPTAPSSGSTYTYLNRPRSSRSTTWSGTPPPMSSATSTSSGTTPAVPSEQLPSVEDQDLATGVSQELDSDPVTRPKLSSRSFHSPGPLHITDTSAVSSRAPTPAPPTPIAPRKKRIGKPKRPAYVPPTYEVTRPDDDIAVAEREIVARYRRGEITGADVARAMQAAQRLRLQRKVQNTPGTRQRPQPQQVRAPTPNVPAPDESQREIVARYRRGEITATDVGRAMEAAERRRWQQPNAASSSPTYPEYDPDIHPPWWPNLYPPGFKERLIPPPKYSNKEYRLFLGRKKLKKIMAETKRYAREKAKRTRRKAMGPREIAAGLAAVSRAPTPNAASSGPSRAPTPNVSADQLPPTSMSLPNTTADDDDDQPPIRRPVRRQLGPRALQRAKYAKRRKATPEEKADKLRAKVARERARPWKYGKDIVGRKIRIPKDMDALLLFKIICAHKRTGQYPLTMLQYAPDRVIAETCNICYRALRDPDVYFTAAQRKRLQKMKGIIQDLAYKRLPTNAKRTLIQRGGFDFASIIPMITGTIKNFQSVAKDLLPDLLGGLL